MTQSLVLRTEELKRRVSALSDEFDAWKKRVEDELDLKIHKSQLDALEILVQTLAQQQSAIFEEIRLVSDALSLAVVEDQNEDGDGGGLENLGSKDDKNNSDKNKSEQVVNLDRYKAKNFELVKLLISSQKIWDFFRGKLELRFSEDFKKILWIADTVAWDCHRPVMKKAASFNIIQEDEFREPPLTYITSEFSAATWVRGSRPNDGRDYSLGQSRLPIPVIEIPSDHLVTVWELIGLCHEVGHDIEADLQLREPLTVALKTKLDQANVPQQRSDRWVKWLGEVFADLVGLQLGGPWFAEVLMRLLLLEDNVVTIYSPSDPHPTHYLRILMNAAYVETLDETNDELKRDAKRIRDQWQDLYGKVDEKAEFKGFIDDFDLVFDALMNTPLDVLNGVTVRKLMPYEATDDALIRQTCQFYLTGNSKPGTISSRHCLSAAVMAAGIACERDDLSKLAAIDESTRALIVEKAPKGERSTVKSPAHTQFIRKFALDLAENPIHLGGTIIG